jgi:hypothetical protein
MPFTTEMLGVAVAAVAADGLVEDLVLTTITLGLEEAVELEVLLSEALTFPILSQERDRLKQFPICLIFFICKTMVNMEMEQTLALAVVE